MDGEFGLGRAARNRQKEIFGSRYGDLSSRISDVIESTISFSGSYKNYCVCMVDVANSTYDTAKLTNGKACKYYSIFLNSMATIAKEFGAEVVKNLGDSLLYYFPRTSSNDKEAFIASLECGMMMIEQRALVNTKMLEEGLPSVNYRISGDYGTVLLARSVSSYGDDIFGSPVNMCTKINPKAPLNGMIIGGDLHQIVKSLKKYRFESTSAFSVGFTFRYPLYSVVRNKEDRWF